MKGVNEGPEEPSTLCSWVSQEALGERNSAKIFAGGCLPHEGGAGCVRGLRKALGAIKGHSRAKADVGHIL